MAYINGVNNSVSSIYGNRNVISGLASGLDTESMIENSIKGYKTQISKLMQNRTKVEWQQERYRSIIDKTASVLDKYTSYSSSTNLSSTGFFNSAVNIETQGVNKDMISASGNPTSDIKILGVQSLATNATFTVNGIGGSSQMPTITGEAIDFNKEVEVSNVSGVMTINYGGNSKVNISFGKDEIFKTNEDFVNAIKDKLSKENITINGTTYKASDRINVELVEVDGKQQIKFSDKVEGTGNKVYISGASEEQEKALGLNLKENNESKVNTVIDMTGRTLSKVDGTVGEKLSGQKLTVSLDGVSATITLPTYEKGKTTLDDFQKGIQASLDREFGKDTIKVGLNTDGKGLKFEVQRKGSTLSLSGEPVKHLGFGDNNTSYVDTRKTLDQIWGNKVDWSKLDWAKAEGEVKKRTDGNGNDYYVDSKGYRVEKNKDDPNDANYYRVDEKGEKLYDFNINGVRVGSYNKNTELGTVINAINNNRDAKVSIKYSQATDQFTFESKRGGKAGFVEMGDGLAQMMFGTTKGSPNYTEGKNAVLSMSVNGTEMINEERSDNTFVMDGMTITLKGEFGYDKDGNIDVQAAKRDAVTFKSTTDTKKIIDAVKDMVKDYNEMVKELKDSFSTLPAQRENGRYYEPLTEEDREGMSESAIKAHEEKAKQGILFRDRELSEFYDRLTKGINMGGELGAAMRHIGITAEYNNGLTTLNIDENKLRTALETEPDTVRDVFTQSVENGAKQDGLMQSMKKTMEMYGKVRGGKGILVEKSGSPLAGTTLFQNEMQKQITSFDDQISKVKKKMGDQIDFYTRQFTQMEQLIAQMNSQSSALAGLMGGF